MARERYSKRVSRAAIGILGRLLLIPAFPPPVQPVFNFLVARLQAKVLMQGMELCTPVARIKTLARPEHTPHPSRLCASFNWLSL